MSRLDKLAKALPQSLILCGENGVGLRTVAYELADKNLVNFVQPKDKKDEVDAVNGTIAVDVIRNLYEQTRSKQTTQQIIVIDDADRMSSAAQGAFLKLLEEPTLHTHFILTSHSPGRLLPTVRSRLQVLTLRPITTQQTTDLLLALKITNATRQKQLRFIAEGLPAELNRLCQSEDYFTQRAEITSDARAFLQATPYKKLQVINKYHTNRSSTLQLLDSSIAIARRSLSAKAQYPLVSQLSQLLELRDKISANGNARLQLAQFVI